MRRAIPRALALALLAVLPLTGCQKSSPSATGPTDEATSSATADRVGSPTPNVAMTAGFKVSDVQEAEKVYREFYSAFLEAERAGGALTLPPPLVRVVEPPARANVEALLKSDFEEGVRLSSKEDGSLRLAPAKGFARGDSVVALRACADGRGLRYVRADGASTTGRVTLNYAYFHRNSRGVLAIFQTNSSRDTSPCSS